MTLESPRHREEIPLVLTMDRSPGRLGHEAMTCNRVCKVSLYYRPPALGTSPSVGQMDTSQNVPGSYQLAIHARIPFVARFYCDACKCARQHVGSEGEFRGKTFVASDHQRHVAIVNGLQHETYSSSSSGVGGARAAIDLRSWWKLESLKALRALCQGWRRLVTLDAQADARRHLRKMEDGILYGGARRAQSTSEAVFDKKRFWYITTSLSRDL